MNLESTSGDQIPFSDPEGMFEGFTKEDIISLAYCAGDFMLAVDENKIIRDIAVNVRDHAFANQWIGQKWSDTVTVESRPKIEQLLDAEHPYQKCLATGKSCARRRRRAGKLQSYQTAEQQLAHRGRPRSAVDFGAAATAAQNATIDGA